MEYKKVSFKLVPDSEVNREVLIAKLAESDFDSFTETDEMVEAFIPAAKFSEEFINKETLSPYQFFSYTYIVETIPNQDWNEIWEKNYFKPLLINDECLIRAPFHTEYPSAKYEIIVEPRMAFGTGNHETTFLMISEILQIDLNGKKVLDMGCGTGVLAILASMKGAKELVAIDIDENAYNVTLENTKLNHIPNIKVKLGGADLLSSDNYDYIFANIQRNVLLQDLPSYYNALNDQGTIIMSGFYLPDLDILKLKAESLGMTYISHIEKNNWVVATFAK
jgi:ribosomal protein L11 methyltransferase